MAFNSLVRCRTVFTGAMLFTVLTVLSQHAFGFRPAFQDSAEDAESEVVDGRIVGKVWHTRVNFSDSFKYMQQLREELGIESGPMIMMMPGRVRMGPGGLSRPDDDRKIELKGTLFFLQTVPEPSLNNPISFELIGDQDEFRKYVQEQQSMFGPSAELIGGEDRYEVRVKLGQFTSVQPAPNKDEGGDGESTTEVRQTISIAISAGPSSGDGPPANMKMPTSISTYYRFSDGIMYSSQSKALFTIDLPSRDSMKLSAEDEASDMYADFDFREIPQELKTAFWNTVEASAATWLQRFDNEAIGDYSLRRSIGEGRLSLMKAALFDIERIRLGMKLSPDGIEPVTGGLKVSVRPHSQLSSTLRSLSDRGSRLGGFYSDESPLVISSTLNLPEWTRLFAAAFVESLRLKLRESAGGDEGAGLLIDDLMAPLRDSASAGMMDAAVAMKGDLKSGLVLAGGLRMENAEQFLVSLESLLLARSGESALSVSKETIADHSVVTIRSESTQVPGTEAKTPVNLHLAATGSWLWMAAGGDVHEGSSSRAVITELIQNSSQNTERSGQAMPLYVRFRLDQWLGETEDNFSKAPNELLTSLEKWISRATTPQFSMMINGEKVESKSEEPEFNSYTKKILKPESSQLELKVRAAPEELLVDATVGTGIIKFCAAQYVESQSRMFRNMPIQFQGIGGGNGVKIQGSSIRIGK